MKHLYLYYIRLQRSSFPEVAHRIKEKIFLCRLHDKFRVNRGSLLSDFSQKYFFSSFHFPELFGTSARVKLSWLLNDNAFTLNQDVESIKNFEKKWRNHFFFKVKNRPSDPDIRAVWEPARLQHLLLLQHLDNGCITSDHGLIADYVLIKLLEWLDDNPFPYGPHYMSAMECGLRVPVLIRALLMLNNFKADDSEKVCLAIFQHGWLIRNRLSLYSSLGNHTVAECVGLIMAATLFKQHNLCREWLKTGIKLLEKECSHQILDDGGPAEQSFSYHRFVLDLYWLAIQFLTKNELHDCQAMKKRVLLGESFLHSIQQNDESMPQIGDSDDGFAIGPGLSPLKDIDFLPSGKEVVTFAESGYTIYRNRSGLRILFDHGPLGMEPLNNHGHADALSVFLSVRDKDFLVDPGTFQYNGDPDLRRYFKSTRAHNTVCIDALDQAKQLTGFIWEKPFACSGIYEKTEDGSHKSSGWHNGYRQQNIPVTHYRTLLCTPGADVVIVDRFEGDGDHEFALHFHCHPDVIIERRDARLYLKRENVCISMDFDSSEMNVLQGQKNPLAGWYSPAYGILIPAATIRIVKKGLPGDVSFTTRLKINCN